MTRQKQEATWPFLCILGCLFVLSAASPRAWERLPAVAKGHAPELAVAPALAPSAAGAVQPTDEPAEAVLSDPAERVAGPANDLILPELAPADPAPPAAVAGDSRPADPVPLTPAVPPAADTPEPGPGLGPAFGPEPVVAPPVTALPKHGPQTSEVPENPAALAEAALGPFEPSSLIVQLEALAGEPEVGPWATEVLGAVRRLAPALGRPSEDARAELERLCELGRASDALEARLFDGPVGRRLRQARFALHRRVDLWRRLLEDDKPDGRALPVSDADAERLALAVAELDAMTAGSPEGRAWRRYLLVDSLKELTARPHAVEDQDRRDLARRVLERLTRRGLDPQQQRFLNTGPVAALGRHLRALAVDADVDLAEVMRHVEQYESSGQPSDARALADDCQRLAFAADEGRRGLGQRLQTHYRNANLRVVLTEELLNRLMPERDPQYQWVHDTVLGSAVRGRSLTFTDVAVRTVPDARRLRLALEVTGRVSSATSATNGPATFYNRSEAVYVARKPLELGTFGVRLWPADVEVRNTTRLRGVETDFDPVPFLGAIIQEVARSQHESKRCEANREIERKVAARAKAQIDAEADARLTSVSRRLHERILGPMADLGLGPDMIEAHTAEGRLTMRLRVGGDGQLGGSTPRPWAPSDSLASFQAHESAVNNFIDRLDLAGRTFTLPQLREWVAARINRPEFADRTSDHDEVTVTFAERDPVVVRCEEGRFCVTLAIAYLRKDPNEWSDFRVRAFYRPEIDRQSARLVRDGVVHLLGEFDMRSQIGLRGLFGKAFDKDKPIDLTPGHVSSDPRMADLSITQFVIEDGWVGFAVGPKRPGAPPEVVRRPGNTGPAF